LHFVKQHYLSGGKKMNRIKRIAISLILALVAVATLPLSAFAATPGIYYSASGKTKAVVDSIGNNMVIYFEDGRTCTVKGISHMEGKLSFDDGPGMDAVGIPFMNILFSGGNSMLVSVEKPRSGNNLAYAEIDQWKLDLINAQALNPQITGYEPLDKAVAGKLKELVTDEMSNSQKLLAMYNYILKQGYSVYIQNYNEIEKNRIKTSLLSYESCEAALHILEKSSGVCDNFSALFVAMANALGFETYEMSGQINGSGHVWAIVRMDGKDYIFDPQAEQVNIQNNQVRYMNFCLNTDYATAYSPTKGYLAEQEKLRH